MRKPPTVFAPGFKGADAASYDTVSEAFDRLSETYSAPFAELVVRLAGVRPGDRVLDLACGSGVVTRRIEAAGGQVVGVDLSAGMLRTAAAKSDGPALARMDAESLGLSARSLDAVASLFGFLHFPSPGEALAESMRVLKPGRPIAIAFGSSASLPWPALLRAPGAAWDHVRERRALLMRAPGALEDFLDRRLGRAATAGPAVASDQSGALNRLRSLVARAGFERIRSGWTRRRFTVGSAEAFWELQTVFSSTARKRLAGTSEAQVDALRAEFAALSQRTLDRGGALAYDVAAAWIQAFAPQGSEAPR